MTQRELLLGSATFVVVIVVGFLSSVRADRYFAANIAQVPSTSSACVTEDGSWKNWLWPNVPALSPKCE
ncbi:MAG TPA: hypothetical protein VFL62_21670 [Bradyrhizobium sp.]|uniref:hypothetical protein n=1 Tax=Bradyrhizobium sp. TaxID=376 RepID=UPI002D7E1C4D|nr:hypothetical protein [Bradyrhizobium sp.]HET7888842.1 hypothetical protein [Bradyrhizobium sp.]